MPAPLTVSSWLSFISDQAKAKARGVKCYGLCPCCDYPAGSTECCQQIIRPVASGDGGRLYSCQLCQFKTSNTVSAIGHLKSHTGEKRQGYFLHPQKEEQQSVINILKGLAKDGKLVTYSYGGSKSVIVLHQAVYLVGKVQIYLYTSM